MFNGEKKPEKLMQSQKKKGKKGEKEVEVFGTPPKHKASCGWLCDLINIFGEEGGFRSLRRRICRGTEQLTFAVVTAHIRCVCMCVCSCVHACVRVCVHVYHAWLGCYIIMIGNSTNQKSQDDVDDYNVATQKPLNDSQFTCVSCYCGSTGWLPVFSSNRPFANCIDYLTDYCVVEYIAPVVVSV